MSLSNYTDLKSAVANWLNRSSDTSLVAVVPDLITLAETRFNRLLRLNAQDTTSSGTLSGPLISIPSDLVDLKRITVTANGAEYDLRYLSPEDFDNYASMSGAPHVYTSQTNSYSVAPGPDSNYAYTIYYAARFAALSDASPTNWLLTNAPDVYLYGALLEAEPFLKNDARIPLWASAFQNSIDALVEQDKDMRFPNANLYIRADRWA